MKPLILITKRIILYEKCKENLDADKLSGVENVKKMKVKIKAAGSNRRKLKKKHTFLPTGFRWTSSLGVHEGWRGGVRVRNTLGVRFRILIS